MGDVVDEYIKLLENLSNSALRFHIGKRHLNSLKPLNRKSWLRTRSFKLV